MAKAEKPNRCLNLQVIKRYSKLKLLIMTFEELVLKLEPFRVGTNRADICWELKTPLLEDELDILNEQAERLELEVDETDYVGYPGTKPFHTKSIYRILFTHRVSTAEK